MMRDLQGKVAFVTGAAHPAGIGRAIADALADAGVSVIVSDLAGSEGLEEIGGLACDVTKLPDVQGALADVLTGHGRLDIVVNNAGVGLGQADFLDTQLADWQTSFSVNVMGMVNVCRAALPHLLPTGGSVINVSSMAGLGALPSIPACYTASKFAVIGLTKSLALQYAASGVRFNALCPGSIKTQLHAKSLALIAEEHGISIEEAQAIEDAAIPVGHSADASEVGNAAVFLASDQSKYLTGVSLPVAGGMAPGL